MKSRLKSFLLLVIIVLMLLSFMTSCSKSAETYSVTFMVDDKVFQTKEVKSGEGIIPPAVPEKTGYNGQWDINIFTKVYDDMIVNAVYTKKVLSVIFKAEDQDGVLKTVVTKSVQYGESISVIPQVPQREGYSGIWNQTTFTDITLSSEVLAIYTKNTYTVDFVANGGTTVEGIEAEYLTPLNVSTQREGYEFMGWYSDALFSNPFNQNFIPAQNITLYAKWALIEFSINIFTGITELDTVLNRAHGSVIDKLTEYAKTGYKFNGWFLDNGYNNPVVFPYTITNNASFYADWIKDNRLSATSSSFFIFNEQNSEISLNSSRTPPEQIVIPSIYANNVVKKIAKSAFYNTPIVSVRIPESIVEIGDLAFSTTPTLTQITFDENSRLKRIGHGAFSNTALESITIPESIQHIGHAAFQNSIDMNFPNIWDLRKLQTIGGLAFDNTFWYNDQLEGLQNTIFYINNVLYSAIGEINEGITLNPITVSISSQAFINQQFINLNIPDSVKYIGGQFNSYGLDIKGAFYGCSKLEQLNSSDTSELFQVGKGAFIGCNSIVSLPITSDIAMPELFGQDEQINLYHVNYDANDYYVPTSLIEIKLYGDTDILPYSLANVTSIENIIFYGDYKNIGEYAFSNCVSLKSISILDSIENIGNYAFSNCIEIANVNISTNNTLKAIGNNAFENLEKASFDIEAYNNLISVGENAFLNCQSMHSFYAPSITEIGQGAFAGCKELTILTVTTEMQNVYLLFDTESGDEESFYIVENYSIPSKLAEIHIVSVNEEDNIVADNFLKDFISVISVYLPEGIISIGDYAFSNLNIDSINIPNSIKNIGEYAFSNNTSLISVSLSEISQLVEITNGMFADCQALSEIYIPKSVADLSLSAFNGCSSLSSIVVDAENQNYYSYEGALYKEKSLILYPQNKKDTRYVLNDGTEHISSNAFANSKLKNIVFPESFISVATDGFQNCDFDSVSLHATKYLLQEIFPTNQDNITFTNYKALIINGQKIIKDFAKESSVNTVLIEKGVEHIGDNAFQDCSELVAVTLPETIQEIGQKAFDNCMSLETFHLNVNSIKTIKENAFENTLWYQNLENNAVVYIANIAYGYKGEINENYQLTINEGITAIADNAFKDYAYITTINFPSTLVSIGSRAFMGVTGITELVFNDNLQSINDYAFADCVNMQSVDFNNGLQNIGDYSFINCSLLEEITFNEGLQKIGQSAFENNSKLSSVDISNSVMEIGSRAFYNCQLLELINLSNLALLSNFGMNVFHNTKWYNDSSDMLTFNNSYLYAFKGSQTAFSIPSSVTHIMPYAFANNNIAEVLFNSELVSIGNYAFSNCQSLYSLNFIPNGQLTHIGEYAFKDCISIQEFTIPTNISILDRTVFDGCISLRDFFIENQETNENFQYINNILYNYEKTEIIYVPLTISGVITIEDTITEIPDNAFEKRQGITKVIFNRGLTKIGDYAFKDCELLSEIVFDDNSMLNYIGKQAFLNCSLYDILLPRRLEYIGEDAFTNNQIEQQRSITLQSPTPPIIENLDADAFVFFVPRNSLELYEDNIITNIINPSRVRIEFVINNRLLTFFEIKYGEKLSDIPLVPELEGYNGEWRDLGQVFENNEYIEIKEDIIINADYQKKSYTIEYYNNNQTQLEELTKTYLYNDVVTLPQYEEDAKQFIYWTEDINNKNKFELFNNLMPSRDITLYAVMYEFEFVLDEQSDTYIVYDGQNNHVTPDKIVIPSKFNNKDVTKIGQNAFNSNTKINVISLPATIEIIGNNAFEISSLTEILVQEQSQLNRIEEYAFYNSQLKTINFNNELMFIGQYAFSQTYITELDIIIDIDTIGDYAFAECNQLLSVIITSTSLSTHDIILMNQSIFNSCEKLQSVVLPETLKTLGQSSFEDCVSLKEVNLENISKIGSYSLANTSIEYAYLSQANQILDNAFENCQDLKEIFWENNTTLTYIGKNSFKNCDSLKYFVIPATTETIDTQALYDCDNLHYIVILENQNVEQGSRGLEVLQPTNNSEIDIYVGVAAEMSRDKWLIHDVLLYMDIVNGFVIDSNNDIILYIGWDTNVTIPYHISQNEYVNSINPNTFIGSEHIQTIELTNADIVNNFATNVFYSALNLEEIISTSSENGVLFNTAKNTIISYPANKDNSKYEINSQITEIYDYAFYGAKILESISFDAIIPPQIAIHTFMEMNSNFKIYVPSTAVNTYKEAWPQYSNIIYSQYLSYEDFLLTDHAEGLEISQYIGDKKTVSIPLSINGKNVVSIGNYAFYNSNIEDLTIPTNIKYIGNYAFAENLYLHTIYLPSAITTMGSYAFLNCSSLINFNFDSRIQLTEFKPYTFKGTNSLKTIKIPYNIKTIREGAFYQCSSLEAVVMPSNSALITISDYAFYSCAKLTSINLGVTSKLLTIGSYAFSKCGAMVNIQLPESLKNINYRAFYDCLTLTNVNYVGLSKLVEIGEEAFVLCPSITRFIIPASVTKIAARAFYNNNFTQLLFISGSSLYEIGSFAFAQSSKLKELNIYGDISIIREGAFINSPNLKWLKMQSSTPAFIENDAWDSSLRIYVPDLSVNNYKQVWARYSAAINSLSRISGDYSFVEFGDQTIEIFQYMGDQAEIEVPSELNNKTVVSIGSFAFNKELTSIILPSSITTLKASAFNLSMIETITISQYVTTIENNPFTNCVELESIVVAQDNPNYISQNNALFNKDATKIIAYPNAADSFNGIYNIPSTVNEVGVEAFRGAISLSELYIPDTISIIGNNAFMECLNLSTIAFTNPSTLKYVGENVFTGTEWCDSRDDGVIYLEQHNSLSDGLTVYGYKGQISSNSHIIIDNNAISILPNAFMDLINITKISIPYSVKTIGENILTGCYNIQEITLPGEYVLGYLFGSTEYSGSYKVHNDQNNNDYYLPNGLTKVIISENSQKIVDYAFYNVHNILSVNIPNSIEYIGRYAFFSSSSLMKINSVIFESTALSQLETIGSYAFKDCHQITNFKLPDSVLNINAYAFDNMIRLSAINISLLSQLEFIGYSAFANCSALLSIHVPYTTKRISDRAFYNCRNLYQVIFALDGLLSEIGSEAFMNCVDLLSIETPQFLTRIGDKAFYGCNSLNIFDYSRSSEYLMYLGYQFLHLTPYYTNLLSKPENQNTIIYLSKIAYVYNGMISANTILTLRSNTVSLSPYIFANKTSIYEIVTVAPTQTDYTVLVLNSALRIIGRNAFANCSNISSATLPQQLTTIESEAFRNCNYLDNLNFQNQNSLEYIGQNAFTNTRWYDNLYEAYPDRTLLYIGKVAYKYKGSMPSYTEIILREDTVSISPYAFENSENLVSIIIPSTIKDVNQFAFGNHLQNNERKMQTIYIDDNALLLNNINGIFTSASKVILNTSPVPLKGKSYYTVEINNNGIMEIITEQMNIMEIIAVLKKDKQLPQIYVPETYYEQYLLEEGWSALSDYILPHQGVYLNYVIAKSNEGDGVDIVYYTGTDTNILMPDIINNHTVVGIRSYAFNTNIQSIFLSNTIRNIYDYAFANNISLQSIDLPINLEYIGNYAFTDCYSLNGVTIPTSVRTIGSYAFYKCISLHDIEIMSGLKVINKYAFAECSALEMITLPFTVEFVGDYVFDECIALLSLVMKGSNPPILESNGLFYRSTLKIYLSDENHQTYITDFYWKKYINRTYKFSDMTDFILDYTAYYSGQPTSLNYFVEDYISVYFANENNLNYDQLIIGYVPVDTTSKTILMPKALGEYTIYIVINNNIVSVSENVVSVQELIASNEYQPLENIQMNFFINNQVDVYIAPINLNYTQLTSEYTRANNNQNNYVTMPSEVGEYLVYIVYNGEIISISQNIINIALS